MATWVVAVLVAWALMATLLTLLLARSLRVLGGGPDLRGDDRERPAGEASRVPG
jgi:hypothetical protein